MQFYDEDKVFDNNINKTGDMISHDEVSDKGPNKESTNLIADD